MKKIKKKKLHSSPYISGIGNVPGNFLSFLTQKFSGIETSPNKFKIVVVELSVNRVFPKYTSIFKKIKNYIYIYLEDQRFPCSLSYCVCNRLSLLKSYFLTCSVWTDPK